MVFAIILFNKFIIIIIYFGDRISCIWKIAQVFSSKLQK